MIHWSPHLLDNGIRLRFLRLLWWLRRFRRWSNGCVPPDMGCRTGSTHHGMHRHNWKQHNRHIDQWSTQKDVAIVTFDTQIYGLSLKLENLKQPGLGFFRKKPISSGTPGKKWKKPISSSFVRTKLEETGQNYERGQKCWEKHNYHT